MRIILDTDKKTIMLPWNYRAKLEEINKLIADVSDDPQKQKTFTGYIDEIWRYAIEHSDTQVFTGQRPKRPDDKEKRNG